MPKRLSNSYGPPDARLSAAQRAGLTESHDAGRPSRQELLSGSHHPTADAPGSPAAIMTSEETSAYLWQRWRLQRSPRRLGQLRAGPAGSGPEFHRVGTIPLYTQGAVDAWAQAQLGESFVSTSDEQAHYAQQRKRTTA